MMIAKMLVCASALLIGAPQPEAPKASAKSEQAGAKGAPKADTKAKDAKDKVKADAKAKDKDAKASGEAPDRIVDGVKLAAIEANVVSYTNDERVRNGLPPLQVDKELMQTAREHTVWMTANESLVHSHIAVAENIAMGQPHSSDVVECWMNSSGHRANILNPGHRRIGVAAFRARSGVIFWCQQFGP